MHIRIYVCMHVFITYYDDFHICTTSSSSLPAPHPGCTAYEAMMEALVEEGSSYQTDLLIRRRAGTSGVEEFWYCRVFAQRHKDPITGDPLIMISHQDVTELRKVFCPPPFSPMPCLPACMPLSFSVSVSVSRAKTRGVRHKTKVSDA